MEHEAPGPQRPTSTTGGVVRAALLGLCGGTVIGGLVLLGMGLHARLAPTDCTALSEVECGFTRDAALEVSRVQSVSGAALLALGIAVIILLRSRPPASPPP